MAKLTKKELESIISKDAPGYEVVHFPKMGESDESKGQVPKEPDAGTPSLSKLKQKPNPPNSARPRPVSERKATDASRVTVSKENDHEMIVIRPKSTGVSDGAIQDRAAIVSKKDKRITGMQG